MIIFDDDNGDDDDNWEDLDDDEDDGVGVASKIHIHPLTLTSHKGFCNICEGRKRKFMRCDTCDYEECLECYSSFSGAGIAIKLTNDDAKEYEEYEELEDDDDDKDDDDDDFEDNTKRDEGRLECVRYLEGLL